MPTKTPTSSLSVVELLAKRALYRTLARIRRMQSGDAPLETPTALPSPSSRTCTLTCYSWYIAAVPRLHRTLTITTGFWYDKSPRWPTPIWYMHLHGLLPLVKTFCLRRGSTDYRGVSPKLFNCCTLRRFSALSNVQELDLEDLDIPKFMPRIRRYFGHFVPTVRTLILKEPRGSRRQIIYFIGLFQNLQNLALYDDAFYGGRKEDLTLVPPSIPPLQGWLTIKSFARADLLLKDMIDLFGGIRFSQLWLYNTGGMQRLLSACAKTLRTVVLSPTDTYTIPSLQDLSLSQNKSLREIHIPASSITSQDTTFSFLKHVLSTVAPLRFLKIVVLYWDCDLRPYSQMSQAEINQEASRHHERFALLREVHKVRDFRLTLSASVSGALGEYPAQILERAVAEEKAKNGFDEIFPVPSVLYYPIRP